MKKLVLLLIVPLALLLGVRTASAQETTTPARTQMKASSQRAAASAEALWNSYRPETLNGTVSLIDASEKSVFVTGSEGVSYKFLVTPKTKIEINGMTSSFDDLVDQTHKQITVTFVARRNGNFAQRISVSG